MTVHELTQTRLGSTDRVSVVEASELNISPGEWPDVLRVTGIRGQVTDYKLRDFELSPTFEPTAANYQTLDENASPRKIVVLNG